MAFQKITDSDTLVDWKNKFNNNVDETVDLKNRLDVLEAGGTTDGELIALRSSTTLSFTGATADERVEHAEQKILEIEQRVVALENRDLKILNVRDFGATGDGVTDDTAAIQAALDAANSAGGGEVYVPTGSYALKAPLRIYSNTRLRADKRATFIRAASYSPMLLPGIGDVDGYEGVQNVEVSGGTWDGNGSQFPSGFSHLMFGHARNILIQDVQLVNNYNSHCIELNACQNVIVRNCIMKGYAGTRIAEAVQIDLAKDSNVFPPYGNYDNTPCDNILISGCVVEDYSRGIGGHNATAGVFHTNIRIIGCHFRNLTDQAIRGYQWKYVSIIGNTFENCRMGIEMRPGSGADASSCGYYTIKGNVFNRMTSENDGYGVWLNGDPDVLITDTIVAENVVNDAGNDGIYISYCTRCTIANNIIRGTDDQGISVFSTTYSNFMGNTVTRAQYHGIVLNDSDHNVVQGNICYDNQRIGAGAENANIALVAGSDYNNVQGNTCRRGSYTDYGIYETNTCTGNLITNNDLYRGGHTANLQANGSGTITTAGNRT